MSPQKSIKDAATGTEKSHRKVFNTLQQMSPHDVDALFHGAHERVFSYTDCLACANCCKTTPALITSEDVNRIAPSLGLTAKKFRLLYTRTDEDGDEVIKTTPCPFLQSDNACAIYGVRPKSCREYPHTDRKKMKQILAITWENRSVCPAVFDMVESIERDLKE
jgi:uncharacterized protein